MWKVELIYTDSANSKRVTINDIDDLKDLLAQPEESSCYCVVLTDLDVVPDPIEARSTADEVLTQ